MATYSKLWFTNSDYALGFRTINQGINNIDAVYNAMTAAHVGDAALSGNLVIGQHDDATIPRDVIQLYGTTVTAIGRTSMVAASPGNYCNGVALYLGVGVYFVPVFGLKTYWGEGIAKVSGSSSAPNIMCRSNYPTKPTTSGSLGAGIIITCYEVSSGTAALTDFDVTLTIYGRR